MQGYTTNANKERQKPNEKEKLKQNHPQKRMKRGRARGRELIVMRLVKRTQNMLH